MHARMGRVSMRPDKLADVVENVRQNVVPKYEGRDGFKGFTLLVDPAGGQAIGISFWETDDAMRATDDIGDEARSSSADVGGGEDEGMKYYEVAIDTMA